MTADNLTVGGRRFRSRADYEAALRDQKKIDAIQAETDMDSPAQIYELYSRLQNGSYRFETVVGTDFDDSIYEKIEQLKAQGITPQNAALAEAKQSSAKTRRQKASLKPKLQKTAAKTEKHAAHAKAEKDSASSKFQKQQKNKINTNDPKLQSLVLEELQKREKRRRLIMVTASIVAVLSFGYFGVYSFFSARTAMDYEQLADLKGSDVLSNSQAPNTFAIHKSSVSLPDVLDEYKTLYEKNKRLIGWLKIDDTIIDYPVMQTDDNDYYLTHNFNQEYDSNGSIFLDKDCVIYPRSTNLIVYGHHMKSGKMFGQLQKYASKSYWEKHSTIQFDSIYEKAEYQVMFAFRSQVYNDNDIVFKYYQFIDANSEEEFNSYMTEMEALSLYDTGVTASYGDSLLTLSTCDNSQTDGRFVVVAKRIR